MPSKEQSEFVVVCAIGIVALIVGFAAGSLWGEERGRKDVYYHAAFKDKGAYRLDPNTGESVFEWFDSKNKCAYCGDK